MRTCAWIFNADVRESLSRGEAIDYCDAPVMAGSSYCTAHHRRCYKPAEAVDKPLPAEAGGNEYVPLVADAA